MTQLHLRRVRRARQTLGLLSVYEHGERVWTCVTSELPWRDNENCRSCIPPGPEETVASYHVRRRDPPEWSTYQYPHLKIEGVPERSAILVHRGNFVADTEGCILVGKKFADIDGDGVTDITRSTETLQRLFDYVPAEAWAEMQIRWMDVPDVRGLLAQDDNLDVNEMIAEAELT